MKQAVCVLITVPGERLYVVVSRRGNETLWGMPGGKVDEGETLLEAAVRETKEEIGFEIDPKDLNPIHTSVCKGETDYETTTFEYTGRGPDYSDYHMEDGLVLGYANEEELCDPEQSPFAPYNRRVFDFLKLRTKMRKTPAYGDVFTLPELREVLASGSISPDDGSGYWAIDGWYSWDHSVFDARPDWATHAVWFNK